MSQLISSFPIGNIFYQSGYGVPTHIATRGCTYIDVNTGTMYINKDGIVDWVNFLDYYTYLSLTTDVITTSAATLDININYYGVNYNGNVDLILPNLNGKNGYNINIKDEGGYAGNHRIRLIPSYGLIDNNQYIDMSIDYMSLHIIARDNNWWVI